MWILVDLLAIPYGIAITAWWRPTYVIDYYPRLSLLVVLWERSVASTIPAVVFFLTLDRCLALLWGAGYRSHHGKITCATCCLVVTALTSFALYLYLAPEFMSAEQKKALIPSACTGLFCFFNNPNDWQYMVRIVFGTLNLVTSFTFFGLLRRQHKKTQKFTGSNTLKNTANVFIIYATSSEILLNFLPHAGCLLYELITNDNIGSIFGTASRVVTSLDAVMCAAMYYHRMRKSHLLSSTIQSTTQSTAVKTTKTVVSNRIQSVVRLTKTASSAKLFQTR